MFLTNQTDPQKAKLARLYEQVFLKKLVADLWVLHHSRIINYVDYSDLSVCLKYEREKTETPQASSIGKILRREKAPNYRYVYELEVTGCPSLQALNFNCGSGINEKSSFSANSIHELAAKLDMDDVELANRLEKERAIDTMDGSFHNVERFLTSAASCNNDVIERS